MARQKVTQPAKTGSFFDLKQQGANALLAATVDFLIHNNVKKKDIKQFVQRYCTSSRRSRSLRIYRELECAQEDMGLIIATWFSHPKFIHQNGDPIPLTTGKGARSIGQLVRASGAKLHMSMVVV